MSRDLIENIEDELYNLTSFPVNIGEIPENSEYEVPFKAKYYLDLWFNDMFGWALSCAMTFIVPNETIQELIIGFREWYDLEGKATRERFDAVKYPTRSEEKGYDWNEVENYFNENAIIGKDLENSLNAFCGFRLNDIFKKDEGDN